MRQSLNDIQGIEIDHDPNPEKQFHWKYQISLISEAIYQYLNLSVNYPLPQDITGKLMTRPLESVLYYIYHKQQIHRVFIEFNI